MYMYVDVCGCVWMCCKSGLAFHQLWCDVGGFLKEIWYLARFLIVAFFVTTLVSSALFTQMKGGCE